MIPKSNICLIFSLMVVLLLGCNEEVVKNDTEILPTEQHAVVDEIFGTLTDQEQYYQHLLIEIPAVYQTNMDSLGDWILSVQPGGLCFTDWEDDSLVRIKTRLDSILKIQPIYLDNFYRFLELNEYPYWEVNAKNRDPKWMQVFKNGHVGMIDIADPFLRNEAYFQWTDEWSKDVGESFISYHFKDTNVAADFERFASVIKSTDHLVQLNLSDFDTVKLNKFRSLYKFKGQFVVKVQPDAINTQLEGGADFIRLTLIPGQANPIPFKNWKINKDNRADYDESTQRILSLKSGLKFDTVYRNTNEQKESVRLNFASQSSCLIKNEDGLIPLTKGAQIFTSSNIQISAQIRAENKLKLVKNDLNDLKAITKQNGVKIMLCSDSLSALQISEIRSIEKDDEIVFCFSNIEQYELFKEKSNVLYIHPELRKDGNENIFIQLLTQQLTLDGDFFANNKVIEGNKIQKNKLSFVQPSYCGLSRDTLRKIDYAVNSAISGKAFPGCQVLLAKDGHVFYQKSFGGYTYEDPSRINQESMYDVASLTKVVATTMVGMLLYEQGAYDLSDSLKDYLPDSLSKCLPYPSTIRNITFQELFTHQSGLPAGFPVLSYMQYTNADIGRLDKYYCDKPDSIYTIEVAENFYLEQCYQDSMWLRLNQMWLDPGKEYKYSDVNMNTLYFIFKSIIHSNPEKFGFKLKKDEMKSRDLFVELLYNKLYNELKMTRTKYKPLNYFPKEQIVPTENERFWRKQLLRGHVHDPNAALYGGIAGNAGIFSTSIDLAILCEMLRQKGTYAGQRYFKAETVEKFTSAQANSFRGLGFNKPSLNTSAFGCAYSAPQATYGHTGFTGTCIWVDPVNNISFVFLSNRVYPQVNNRIYQYGIRRNIHQLAYDSRLFMEE